MGDYSGAQALVTEDMLRLGIVGTPRDVIRQLEELGKAGIDEVGLGGPLGPDPGAAIDLLGQEVIPYFRCARDSCGENLTAVRAACTPPKSGMLARREQCPITFSSVRARP